jgi:hypothetical protein
MAGDRLHGGRTIVAQLAEGGRNEIVAGPDERDAHDAECDT